MTYTPLGSAYAGTYNALGFDPNNDYLYATTLGGNTLLQIDANGGVTSLGAISGYTAVSNQPADGAFDGSSPANYWITGGNGSTTAEEINVTSSPPAVVATLKLSAAWEPIDFSWDSGYMWGLSGTTIYRLSLSTGTVTTFPAPSEVTSGNFGAAWTLSNGNLDFSNNATGDIYQIAVTNPSSSPSFSVVSHYTGPVAGQSNDGAACVAPLAADLAITKSAPASVNPSGTITWTMQVTNNGPGNSSGSVVSDTLPAGITNIASSTPGCEISGSTVRCSEGALSVGQSYTVAVTGTAPSTYGTCVTNSATVTGNETDSNPSNNTASVQTCTAPGISIVKSANLSSFSAPGTVITYTYKVTNLSAAFSLTGVTVTDPMSGLSAISCPGSTLAPSASMSCTATYTTTQADVDRGSVTNTGTATGTPPSGPAITAKSSVTVTATQSPSIGLLKTASPTTFTSVGQTITYSYKVTNTGNVTLTSVGVTDPMAGLSAISCPSSSLAPGASETCTATYKTTQADVDAGSISNTGTATGTPPSGPAVTETSTVTIPATRTPGIALAKSATPTSYSAPGTLITYSYLVTNTGNVTLSSVHVTDPMTGLSAITCPTTTLSPGANETCTATYTTTQADVDHGSITNTGTATGTPPGESPVDAQSTTTVVGVLSGRITLVKSASISSFSEPGTLVTYSYLVSNPGNLTLTSVGVTDPMDGLSAIRCPTTTLAPGASETCTATYTTTQDDVDAGQIVNTGTASGTTPQNVTLTATSRVSLPAVDEPAISLSKSASVPNFNAPGTAITYSYLVTNSGNETLNDISVSDPMFTAGQLTCPSSGPLDPKDHETCTATYTTTQADVDRGSITNTATATGTPPSGPNVSATSTVTVPAVQTPTITLAKSASPTSYSAPGVPITYSYLVTNTGNVTLTDVEVSDPMFPAPGELSCPSATLDPGDHETCTATYTTTQADVDRGSITNTGTASGTPPSGPAVTAASTVKVLATQTPGITLVKSASPTSFAAAGVQLTYSYRVTNSGNVTLTGVGVTDPMPGLSAISCPDASLTPSQSETCTASYTTTQADVDAGGITNTGTATGTPPTGPVVTGSDTITVPATRTPGITIAKTANVASFAAPGVPITYHYLVTNSGNVTLTAVGVTDPMFPTPGELSCPTTTLDPGASESCTAHYTTTQANVDAGGITNTGTATGTPPAGPAVTDSHTLTIPAVQTPGIGLTKSANLGGLVSAGQVITYSYQVSNTGNVTLDPVTVTDPMAGLSAISCPATLLAPGAGEKCTATYTTTQADIDRGSVTNTGTVTGTPPSGPAETAQSTVTIPVNQVPAITVVKTASISSFALAGTPISYSYLLTNAGNVTLTSVTLVDSDQGRSGFRGPTCPAGTLAPGASETCTATYTTTQADVDAGGVTNTATATGTTPQDTQVSGSTTLTVPAVQQPAISISKTASVPSFDAAGTLITYSYLVTNSGNDTLDPVTVTDPMPGLSAISCPVGSLGRLDAETCTATYTTTQADVDQGSITNTGTATGTPPSGPVVTAQSTLTVPAIQHPSIGMTKSANPTSFSAAGTTIDYSYLVTNTGNITLNRVTVADPMPGLTGPSCPDSTLAPGASETCTATYVTTQADVDRGSITNLANASAVPNSPQSEIVSHQSTVTVPAISQPSISLLKTASVSSVSVANTPITYSYLVTNSGNETLDPVTVTDPMPGLSAIACPPGSLTPGGTETCTASYTTTQRDIDRGVIDNTGTATGTPPAGPPVTAQSSVSIPVIQAPGIGLVKRASVSSFAAPGTPITYRYLVTNSGDETLSSIAVHDAMPGLSAISCPTTTLDPGLSETCTATYTTTQADVDAGGLHNTATVTGTPATGAPVEATASATVAARRTPGLALLKSASVGSYTTAGTKITYRFKVTNTGNVTIHGLAVHDAMPGLSRITCPTTTLAPQASVTCTASYTTTAADVTRGELENTAYASGVPPEGGTVKSASSKVTIPRTPVPAPPTPSPPPQAPVSPIAPTPLPVTG